MLKCDFSLPQEQYELVHRAIAQLFEKQLLLLESPTNSELTDGMVSVDTSLFIQCPAYIWFFAITHDSDTPYT